MYFNVSVSSIHFNLTFSQLLTNYIVWDLISTRLKLRLSISMLTKFQPEPRNGRWSRRDRTPVPQGILYYYYPKASFWLVLFSLGFNRLHDISTVVFLGLSKKEKLIWWSTCQTKTRSTLRTIISYVELPLTPEFHSWPTSRYAWAKSTGGGDVVLGVCLITPSGS